jgi:Protein of unknown function (DUF2871)
MLKNPETVLFRSAAAWAVIGLAGGLAYREVTRAADYTGVTQLSLVHTHALALGTLMLLVTLALERLFTLSADRRLGWFVWAWNVGLALTIGALAVKGSLQVAGAESADSPALAGIAGTGHIGLAVGFALLFVVLGARIRDTARAAVDADPAAQLAVRS